MNTTINENTNILEYQTPDFRVPFLPLSMMLIAFKTSHTLNTKDTQNQKKKHSLISSKVFTSKKHQFELNYYATIKCQLNKT